MDPGEEGENLACLQLSATIYKYIYLETYGIYSFFISFFLSFLQAIVCFKNMNFKNYTSKTIPFTPNVFFFSFWRKITFFPPDSVKPSVHVDVSGSEKSGPGKNVAASTGGTDNGTSLTLIQPILAFNEQIKGFHLFVFVFSHIVIFFFPSFVWKICLTASVSLTFIECCLSVHIQSVVSVM